MHRASGSRRRTSRRPPAPPPPRPRLCAWTIERRRAINRLSSEAGGIFIAYRDDSRSQGRRFVDGIGIRRLVVAGGRGALPALAAGGAPPPARAGPHERVSTGQGFFPP